MTEKMLGKAVELSKNAFFDQMDLNGWLPEALGLEDDLSSDETVEILVATIKSLAAEGV